MLDVAYPLADDSAADTVTMVPVYRGNVVKPAEATLQPEVSWVSRSPEDLWCLVMTGLDTHLTQVRTFSEVYVRRELGLPFSEEKNYSAEHGTYGNFLFIPTKIRLFCGTENTRNPRKTKKARNSVPNHFH